MRRKTCPFYTTESEELSAPRFLSNRLRHNNAAAVGRKGKTYLPATMTGPVHQFSVAGVQALKKRTQLVAQLLKCIYCTRFGFRAQRATCLFYRQFHSIQICRPIVKIANDLSVVVNRNDVCFSLILSLG